MHIHMHTRKTADTHKDTPDHPPTYPPTHTHTPTHTQLSQRARAAMVRMCLRARTHTHARTHARTHLAINELDDGRIAQLVLLGQHAHPLPHLQGRRRRCRFPAVPGFAFRVCALGCRV